VPLLKQNPNPSWTLPNLRDMSRRAEVALSIALVLTVVTLVLLAKHHWHLI